MFRSICMVLLCIRGAEMKVDLSLEQLNWELACAWLDDCIVALDDCIRCLEAALDDMNAIR